MSFPTFAGALQTSLVTGTGGDWLWPVLYRENRFLLQEREIMGQQLQSKPLAALHPLQICL